MPAPLRDLLARWHRSAPHFSASDASSIPDCPVDLSSRPIVPVLAARTRLRISVGDRGAAFLPGCEQTGRTRQMAPRNIIPRRHEATDSALTFYKQTRSLVRA